MKKVIVLFIVLAILFSSAGFIKKDPLEDLAESCVMSFVKAYLVNNFEYDAKTRYYISERLPGFGQKKSKTIQFPCYYFIYDKENILFCVGLYMSEYNDTGGITYQHMGKYIYCCLVDETTTALIKEANKNVPKNKINKEINLSGINNIAVCLNLQSEETSLKIKELLVELSQTKISKMEYTAEDRFYVKNPIRDYTIVIEDKKNISINEKLLYPLFMNDKIIALFEFNAAGDIVCTLAVDQESLYARAYQQSDKFILIHGGDYPYLKTYCLFGDQQLDSEVLLAMLKDPIFIKTKREIDNILNDLKPYETLLEIESAEI